VEIPSPFSGVAKTVHVQEGQVVNVGDVIVTFEEGNGSAPAVSLPTAKLAPTQEAAPQASPADLKPTPVRKTTAAAAPAVRKLARELRIDLNSIVGTGPGGRITREDLERHAGATAPTPTQPRPGPSAAMRSLAPAVVPPGIAGTDKWGSIRREPLNQIRKTIASQMSRSASTIPHVTHMDEADITELDRIRRELNEATNNDPRLTAMSFLIRATCLALRRFPIFNASFDEEGGQIIYKEYINIGIAVDTQRGLVVPVIRNADQLSLRGIGLELRTLADHIRTNQFAIEDLRGGTFTITNVGALGGLFSTPIINHPEVAILALGRSRQVPIVRNGEIMPALVLPVALSFDHRATDGANAARFTGEIISYLEKPARFLLE
jgi:pyruvate dehydrogenase E2 component (dihydrolipoamide acetyltransferase)